MIPMSIKFLEPDERAWDDVSVIHPDCKIELAISPHAMTGNRPAVFIRIDVDGQTFVVPTSARLYCTMAKMIEARFPELFYEGHG